ncbi:MAG: hypothetical protein O9301_00485 [Leptospira sp.]|nr:hypothetical protein [Leptospira sp.]
MKFNLLFGICLVVLALGCSSKDAPSESELKEQLYGKESEASVRILGSKQINLDENPDLEVIVLSQSGKSEVISTYKKLNGSWQLIWKQEFFSETLGPTYYDPNQNRWISGKIPGTEKVAFSGDLIRRVVLAELPGDSFNSVFLEVLVEEPPLGQFSIPLGYRKGKKIWDGFQLKEHEELVRTKRLDFEYIPKEKSFRIFNKSPNYSQEFVFNSWEMIPNLPMQPIPSFLTMEVEPKWELGKESLVTIQLKNRGNFVSLTYLTFSFPNKGNLRLAGETAGVRVYKKGEEVFNKQKSKRIPADYPMLEVTKEGWASQFRYGVKFYYTPLETIPPKIFFRSTYKFYQDVVSIPNQYSISNFELDQQGFFSYILPSLSSEKNISP